MASHAPPYRHSRGWLWLQMILLKGWSFGRRAAQTCKLQKLQTQVNSPRMEYRFDENSCFCL